jgi:hypothetical protein
MDFRRTAATAMLGWYITACSKNGGWYLVVAPVSYNSRIETNAPLRQWIKVGEFNSSTECDNQRSKWLLNAQHLSYDVPGGTWPLCVAADDPSLKGKP